MAAGDGMIPMKPTSIVHTGTSATINSNGGVDFTSVTSLSLNGVFTALYENYIAYIRVNGASSTGIDVRWRAAGSDNSTASSYTKQYIAANGTTISGARSSSDTATVMATYGSARSGTTWMIYAPYLARATVYRTIPALDSNNARIEDYSVMHNQLVSYDGFTLNSAVAITGNIAVFGYEE